MHENADKVSSAGVEPGLPRPQRDALTARRWGQVKTRPGVSARGAAACAFALGTCRFIAKLKNFLRLVSNAMWAFVGFPQTRMGPRGLGPRTLRLLAVRSSQLSYRTKRRDLARVSYTTTH